MEGYAFMTYTLPFTPQQKVIELGGGNRPYFRPNLDVRSGENIDIVADFNEVLPLKSIAISLIFSIFEGKSPIKIRM